MDRIYTAGQEYKTETIRYKVVKDFSLLDYVMEAKKDKPTDVTLDEAMIDLLVLDGCIQQ